MHRKYKAIDSLLNRSHKSGRLPVGKITTGCFLAMILAPHAHAAPVTDCNVADDDLAGTVFRDYNHNGVNDALTGPDVIITDPAITVTAYDNSNTAVATTTLRSDGNYLFEDLFTSTTAVRLEFSSLPAYLQPGITGTNNSTTVQFHSAASCQADLGIHNPADYCEADPDVAATIFHNGDNNTATGTLVSVKYDHTNDAVTTLAVANETGSIWGVTHAPQSATTYSAAFLKWHVGFG